MVNKELIIKLYKQGKSISAIALEAGCGRAYVYKVLGDAGLIGTTEPPSVMFQNLMKLKKQLVVFKDKYASRDTKLVVDKLLREADRLMHGMKQK